MSVAGGGGVFNHQSNVVRLSPCMAVRLAPSLPLNCSETGLFRDGFASLICFAETGEKREREKKRVGEQLRSRLGVSLHDCEKNKTTFSCTHPILIRL